MDCLQCLSTVPASTPTSSFVPRIHSTADLTKLCRSSRPSIPDAASRRSEVNMSENSQVLYMETGNQKRKTRRSLASINNSTCSEMIDVSEAGSGKSNANEEISWNIIEQEILEWQYTCETGRPYWWSEESRYNRSRNMAPKCLGEQNCVWGWGVEPYHQDKRFDRRGKVSESNLPEEADSHALAHKVAVQLLGSCFTLPPDYTAAMSSPDYTRLDRSGRTTLPEFGMISSLRLHGHFRYSPCFGHEPRSSSPVHMWPIVDDRSCSLSGKRKLDHTTKSRKRKARRKRRHSQNLDTESWGESAGRHSLYRNSHEQNLELSAKDTRRQRKSPRKDKIHNFEAPQVAEQYIPEGVTQNNFESTNVANAITAHSSRTHICDNPNKLHPGNSNYHLQPVLRSEPHHVFVQPVKELVVKRWRSIRRFSGSLQSALRSGSDDNISEASSCGSGSVMSSSAVARRRRARERGEIHSSVDNSPHNNSFASENNAEEAVETVVAMDNANSPTKSMKGEPTDISQPNQPLAGIRRSLSLNSTTRSRPVFSSSSMNIDNNSSAMNGISKTLQAHSGFSHSSTRIPRNRGRQSLLSEVCTPEDLGMGLDTIIRRDFGIRDTAHVDGSHRATPTEQPGTSLGFSSIQPVLPETSLDAAEPRTATAIVALKHPLRRTSTSGTQIFTPNPEGMELDGLPVGPSMERWLPGGESKQTYL